MTIEITEQELPTVLAAVRCWQQDLANNEEGPISQDPFDEAITPLTVDEIDALCELLSFGSTTPPQRRRHVQP